MVTRALPIPCTHRPPVFSKILIINNRVSRSVGAALRGRPHKTGHPHRGAPTLPDQKGAIYSTCIYYIYRVYRGRMGGADLAGGREGELQSCTLTLNSRLHSDPVGQKVTRESCNTYKVHWEEAMKVPRALSIIYIQSTPRRSRRRRACRHVGRAEIFFDPRLKDFIPLSFSRFSIKLSLDVSTVVQRSVGAGGGGLGASCRLGNGRRSQDRSILR